MADLVLSPPGQPRIKKVRLAQPAAAQEPGAASRGLPGLQRLEDLMRARLAGSGVQPRSFGAAGTGSDAVDYSASRAAADLSELNGPAFLLDEAEPSHNVYDARDGSQYSANARERADRLRYKYQKLTPEQRRERIEAKRKNTVGAGHEKRRADLRSDNESAIMVGDNMLFSSPDGRGGWNATRNAPNTSPKSSLKTRAQNMARHMTQMHDQAEALGTRISGAESAFAAGAAWRRFGRGAVASAATVGTAVYDTFSVAGRFLTRKSYKGFGATRALWNWAGGGGVREQGRVRQHAGAIKTMGKERTRLQQTIAKQQAKAARRGIKFKYVPGKGYSAHVEELVSQNARGKAATGVPATENTGVSARMENTMLGKWWGKLSTRGKWGVGIGAVVLGGMALSAMNGRRRRDY